ncbi:MAG: response regulator transcription factor [Oscillospiraceae bacterium]|nr:response regulator transcription factor [Oscillospiraceae bacterium]
MTPHVLGVGYSYNEYSVTAQAWKEYGIEFDYADDIKQAAAMLSFKEYICIAICADVIPQEDLDALRKVRPVPIIVVPPTYSETQRYACVHFGVAQYLHTYHHPLAEATTDQNSMLYYLHIPTEKRKPLTIITVKDLSFCLEYRSVEIAGKRIDLTEKEFDILALLIMNQRQVFTHEMMMDAIWHDDFSFYSRNALSSHISNLRKKLKVSESVADHIKSIRGIGYKFEA